MSDPSVYTFEFTIPNDALDENGHVNNVMYVQWMQDVAVKHYDAMGGRQLTIDLGAIWVVRSHKIEYLRPAFAGERIRVETWVENIRKVRSLRCYHFVRISDEQELVRGETDWVFVNASTGRLKAIPSEVSNLFTLVTSE